MTVRSYDRHACPIAQTLSVVGDQWTLLLVRDVLRGARRFETFQSGLGISRNLLARRLKQLVAEGLLERTRIPGSRRYEYKPTEKCRDLRLTILALAEWGERWRADPKGARLELRERETDAEIGVRFCRLDDGRAVDAADVVTRAGPAASPNLTRWLARNPADNPETAGER